MTSLKLMRFLMCGFVIVGCVHGNKRGQKDAADESPEIYANMPLDEALVAGVNHGSKTLGEVKRLIKRRGDVEKAGPLMFDILMGGIDELSDKQLLNASHLFSTTPMPRLETLVPKFVRSPRALANRIGWRFAAIRPSPATRILIDAELSFALKSGEEDRVIQTEMANAVSANRLGEAYTLVREGLMREGGEEYVNAMISLDPDKASWDFVTYLALASAEELRQLTLSSVDLFSCVAILRHLKRVPVPISHGQFDRLFFYSVSRNRALGELAAEVLSFYVPEHTEHIAALLSAHPGWVQIAYLENARRNMTPKAGLVIAELKNVTSKPDVLDEIKNLHR